MSTILYNYQYRSWDFFLGGSREQLGRAKHKEKTPGNLSKFSSSFEITVNGSKF